jgi:hypothetical protein
MSIFVIYLLVQLLITTRRYMRDGYFKYRWNAFAVAPVFIVCIAANISVEYLCLGQRDQTKNPNFCTPNQGWSWASTTAIYLLPAIVLILIQQPGDFI